MQLLKKSSPKLLHQVIVLPLNITKNKIIKFDYLVSAQERKKLYFWKQALSEISDGK